MTAVTEIGLGEPGSLVRRSDPGQNPTLRGRRLAMELLRRREATGMSREEVARQLEWSTSTLFCIETGRSRPKPGNVRILLELDGVTGTDRLVAAALHPDDSVQWRRSSYSSQSGNCVEVARNPPGLVAVRDSKSPDTPKLLVSPRPGRRSSWASVHSTPARRPGDQIIEAERAHYPPPVGPVEHDLAARRC